MDEFNRGNDLTTVDGVVAECRSMADGMNQQALAARTSSAMGGHPHPEFLYGRVSEVLGRAAAMLESLTKPIPQPPVAPNPDDVPPNAGMGATATVVAGPPPNVAPMPHPAPVPNPTMPNPVPNMGGVKRR